MLKKSCPDSKASFIHSLGLFAEIPSSKTSTSSIYLVVYVQDLLSASLTPNFEYDEAAPNFTIQIS